MSWRHLLVDIPICAIVCVLAHIYLPLKTIIGIALIVLAIGIACIWMDKKHK